MSWSRTACDSPARRWSLYGVKIHFAHAGEMFMMSLWRITNEPACVEDIISSRLSPADLQAMQERVNQGFVGE